MTSDLKPANPAYRERVTDSFHRQAFMVSIGAELSRVDPGLTEIRLPWRSDLTQQHGFFHGGLVGALADTASGYAAFSLFPAEATVLTVEFKLNLLAPATGERLRASARVRRSGRTLTVCQADVFAGREDAEAHCATALVTLMRLDGKPDAPPD